MTPKGVTDNFLKEKVMHSSTVSMAVNAVGLIIQNKNDPTRVQYWAQVALSALESPENDNPRPDPFEAAIKQAREAEEAEKGREEIRHAVIEFFEKTDNQEALIVQMLPFLKIKNLKMLKGRADPCAYVSMCIRNDDRFIKIPVGRSTTRTSRWKLKEWPQTSKN
jgi:hypothetical protein